MKEACTLCPHEYIHKLTPKIQTKEGNKFFSLLLKGENKRKKNKSREIKWKERKEEKKIYFAFLRTKCHPGTYN